MQFSYVEPLGVISISPSCGPVTGGTLVTVSGSNFAQSRRLLCRFGQALVDGSLLDASTVVCIAPSQLANGTVSLDLTTVPGIRNKLFGGDGLFLAKLTGPGEVWLQSITLAGLAHALQPYIVTETVAEGGAAAVIGSLLK